MDQLNITERQELADFRAKKAAQAEKRKAAICFRVAKKGGISLYGVGRYPVTLYREQWETVLDKSDELRAFIVEHQGELSTKDNPRAVEAAA